MNVTDMVLRQLKITNHDGLTNGECGCTIHNLMPCGGDSISKCIAAYAWKVKAFIKANEGNEADFPDADYYDFLMSTEKPRKSERYKV